ncbi:MAG: heme ABC exporter ATP-binding protein CcmA [Armatimonadota bacterium]|nr:heme ABC exporter ATP-binding protein CcmA [Armatimonadota bacterium]MDR7518056.1 heme ABC exporter ATP-binding protein CcmA [Armatimonadota bacterium]MDR7550475.1 heme ABC exporter ATP-binding protein CcmA [Armatimonadota bacterium]
MPWAVEVDGVVKAYDHRPVLRGASLCVRTGQTVAVLGANGSGKTTLLRLVATLSPPTRGTVRLFGRPAAPVPEVRRRIGVVPHESLLYDSLTVEENLRFFAGLYGLPRRQVDDLLDRTALRPLASRRARVLSRGQRQQVNLARALLHDPELLILDEPYTGLDLGAADRLTAMLRDAVGQGRTVLLSTHDLAEAQDLTASIAVLLDGRLTEVMPADSLDEGRLAAWFREGRR